MIVWSKYFSFIIIIILRCTNSSFFVALHICIPGYTPFRFACMSPIVTYVPIEVVFALSLGFNLLQTNAAINCPRTCSKWPFLSSRYTYIILVKNLVTNLVHLQNILTTSNKGISAIKKDDFCSILIHI